MRERRLLTSLLFGLASLSACGITEPADPFALYHLVNSHSPALRGQGLPFAWNDVVGEPGDSVQYFSGQLLLEENGVWTEYHVLRYKRDGVWRDPLTILDSGTFTVVGGAGVKAMLEMESEHDTTLEPALVDGREVVFKGLVFARE